VCYRRHASLLIEISWSQAMNRWIAVIAVIPFLCSFSAGSLPAASGLIFEGKVAARDGRPVAGAEVQLLDAAGKLQDHVFSDLQGFYRFPVIPAPPGNSKAYRMELSHLRYQPVKVADAVSGARISRPGPSDLAPDQPVALLAATEVVRRDFVLTPSQGTPIHPALGPIDPNFAEYCYQQGLLLLSQDTKQAVEYFKVYAQTGFNQKQVARSLQMIALHERRQ
jgi:hypothetical protein